MADTNVRVVDLPLKNAVVNDDTVVSVVNGVASRVKISTIKSTVSQWSDLQNKPFDVLDSTYFVIGIGNALTASQVLANSLHTHSNKIYLDKISEDGSGHITYNGESVVSVADWDDTTNKPFEDLSNDFTVTEGTLSISTDIKHTHINKTVIDKFSESNGTLLWDGSEIGGGGLDFSALSDAMTTGTLTGLTITADTTNENFDITVTGLPTISIDNNDEWTIDGVSTGHSCKGDNGLTPTIDSTSKHWMIGSTDTNVVAEGQAGITPSIDNTTKHWMVGSTDTNIVAEGQDGVSPTITVTETTTQFTITIVDTTGTTSFNLPKMLSDVDIIKGRVNTVADLANVSNPEEGWVYLVGLTTDTAFQKYIYIDRDNISRWEIVGGGASGNYAPLDMIADEFDSTSAYDIGDAIIYQGSLYKFKSAHTANTSWNSSEVDEKTVVELIESGGSTPMSIIDTVTAQEITDSINNIWGGVKYGTN